MSRKISHTRSYNIYSHFVYVFSLTKVRKNLKNSGKSAHFQKSAHWQHLIPIKFFQKEKRKTEDLFSLSVDMSGLVGWWGEVNIK